MLESVTVKNLALIREAQISFGKGLNILSGETGAGKSILIGSINLALGAKADKDIIRDGAEYGLVELVFHLEDPEVIRSIRAMELPVEEDGSIIITRKISEGRSPIRVCGESVTVRQVKELAALLIDIHGQHEHQSLLKEGRQRQLLDAYGGEKMEALLQQMAESCSRYKKVSEELSALSMDEPKRQREISLAEYEIREIDEAALRIGEEEELSEELRSMNAARNSFEALNTVLSLTEGEGVLDPLGTAIRELNAIHEPDEKLRDITDSYLVAEDTLRGAAREIHDYMEENVFDARRFAEMEERLDTIRKLVFKYGKDEGDVLAYLEKRKAELEAYSNLDATLEKLQKEKEAAGKAAADTASKIHQLRVKAGNALEKEISRHLTELNFLKVSFAIELTDAGEFTSYGRDEVRFMISLNPGEKMRPLSEVASGGELSRIMLALKSVFAGKDDIGTLIFDEIDTGISGKTAWKVSEKMGALSKDRQLLCITHLPQIAAMADTHFVIEKSEVQGKTETHIQQLSEEEELKELARMLGGDALTEAALENAAELKRQANEAKRG